MKKVIQALLLLILILIIFFFYKFYFEEKPDIVDRDITINKIKKNESNNNFIKNLRYQISIDKNQNYNLESKVSEISYQDGFEIVRMQDVQGTYTDKNFNIIIITSNEALYNNENHNTKFKEKVKLKYMENIIESENLILDFEKNLILISDNVKYSGFYGNLTSDNIELNLKTKKINIFMNKPEDKILVIAK